jgi:hypothetical protein
MMEEGGGMMMEVGGCDDGLNVVLLFFNSPNCKN